MTEPNCPVCIGEAEEELKRIQAEKVRREEARKKAERESKRNALPSYTESENILANHQSLTGSSTVDICPKCGLGLRQLSGNAYNYRHQGIDTKISKQIETKHCQPEQIKEYQKKLSNQKANSSANKLKELASNQITAEEQAIKKPAQQAKLQKQQTFILGGILVSLLGLLGMGI